MFFYDVVTCRCIAYNVVALLAEVNSIFLHSRKLMQISQFPFDHWLYRINVHINLATFVFCRFFSIGTIIHGMFYYHHRVGTMYFICLSFAILVMTVINLILFWRLLKNDIIRYNRNKYFNKYNIANNNVKVNGFITKNGVDKKHQ